MEEELVKILMDKFVGQPMTATTRQEITETIFNYYIRKYIDENPEMLQNRAIALGNALMRLNDPKE